MNNVYEIITNQIIEMLEAGVVPWHKPWNGEDNAPKNLKTKKTYRGINPFILWLNRLRDDKKLVISAAAHAQRACDFIMNKQIVNS